MCSASFACPITPMLPPKGQSCSVEGYHNAPSERPKLLSHSVAPAYRRKLLSHSDASPLTDQSCPVTSVYLLFAHLLARCKHCKGSVYVITQSMSLSLSASLTLTDALPPSLRPPPSHRSLQDGGAVRLVHLGSEGARATLSYQDGRSSHVRRRRHPLPPHRGAAVSLRCARVQPLSTDGDSSAGGGQYAGQEHGQLGRQPDDQARPPGVPLGRVPAADGRSGSALGRWVSVPSSGRRRGGDQDSSGRW